MGRRYDIIQTPKDINYSDLPTNIEISKPFRIKDDVYICEKTDFQGLKVCNEREGQKTGNISSNKHYYVIRKVDNFIDKGCN